MLSIINSNRPVRKFAIPMGLVLGSAVLSPSLAQAQSFIGTTGGNQVVCTGSSGGNIVLRDEDCDAGGTGLIIPQGFEVGNATFNDPSIGAPSTIFSGGGTVLVNVPLTVTAPSAFNGTTTFGGFSVTFNTDTTFTDSTTFNALADFNNGITSNTITNSGTINTSTLSAGTIVGTSITASGALLVSPASNVDMGNNQVHGVAAGVANTDAVNVGQLNAATSGIVTDVTELETLTATHTTQISAIQTVNTTQATQITALQAADLAIDARVDTLELLAEDLDERIGDVDDRASAGTAAAVALSGAMFLPGKSFNLTGNVGTYRGAHAAALQFGALVSDRVALNAGIAHGFNKGGRTALRAGFTIGW